MANDEERKKKRKEREQTPEFKAKRKTYRQRPEVKAKERKYRQRPEVKARAREYKQRPESKAKDHERYLEFSQRREYKERAYISSRKNQEKNYEYRKRPEVKAKRKTYRQRPEVKAKERERKQRPAYKAQVKKHQQRPEVKERRRQLQRERRKKQYLENPNVGRQYDNKLRLEVIMHYTNGKMKCERCDEAETEFLEINHLKSRKEMGHANDLTGSALCHRLRKEKYPEGINILCSNCNWLHKIVTNKDKISISKKHSKQYYEKKIKVMNSYSNSKPICTCCGIDNIDVLSIDHIEAQSYFKGKKYLRGNALYIYLIKNNFPKGY